MIARITRVYTCCYRGDKLTRVEWVDGEGNTSCTEGSSSNAHMLSLIARAKREGIPHTREAW